MANYLDANPEHVATLDHHRADPAGLVPIVRGGELIGMVTCRDIGHHAPPAPVSAEDYVVGLEVLGFRFVILRQDGERTLFEMTPVIDSIPKGWMQLANAIKGAYGLEGLESVAEFVLARDGEPS